MQKLFLVLAMLIMSTSAYARDSLLVVGSSTVFPFATVVAESLGKSGHKTPVIESTGTGGGMKLFCNGVGKKHPDATNASRAIKKSEIEKCKKNGVTPIEVHVGYDGIVLANSKKSKSMTISRKELYKAVAKEVWNGEKFIKNPYVNWSDINKSLPNRKIVIMGPPPTSGTRDAFVELVLHKACKKMGIKKKGPTGYKTRCSAVREDGGYIEAGENDNLIVQKLNSNPDRFGIFGFSFLDENTNLVQGVVINGKEPTFEGIADGSYPISRALYFYVKKEHLNYYPIKAYVDHFMSNSMAGPEGRLIDKGLIPLQPKERAATLKKLAEQLK